MAASSSDTMVEAVFGEKMFQFTYALTMKDGVVSHIGVIEGAAIALCGGLWLIQLAKDIYSSTQGDGQWKEKTFYSVIKLVVVVAVIKMIYISVIMKTLIGGIPEMIAENIGALSMEEFVKKQLAVFDAFAESKNKVGSFLSATLSGGGVSHIIASLGFFFMSAISMVVPLVQKALFEMVAYLGPLAFASLMCEYTRDVFNKWLSMALAISWMPVIFAISMYIFVFGTMNIAIDAAKGEDVFVVAISTIVSCMILVASPVISVYLFSASGAGIERASAWGAVGAAAVIGAKGALPAVGAATGKAKSMGYNEDGTVKTGTGAAVARAAGKAGDIIVRGSSKPGSTSASLSQSLADGNKANASQYRPAMEGTSVPNTSRSTSNNSSSGNSTSANAGAKGNGNIESRGSSIPTSSSDKQNAGNTQSGQSGSANNQSSSNKSAVNTENVSNSSISATGKSTVPNMSQNTVASPEKSSIPTKQENKQENQMSRQHGEFHRQDSVHNMPLEQDIPSINEQNPNINGSIPGKESKNDK
jgi:type IV secretory pathway VirB6-like protein